jgi:hemoglobin
MRSLLGCAPVLGLASILVAGCPRSASESGQNGDSEPEPVTLPDPGSGSKALYVRLGGIEGIRTVVDELVSRMAADTRIQRFFVGTDFLRLKHQLVVHVCQLSGGPCRYRGRSMRAVHRGRRIRSVHFEALMQDARDALRASQIGEKERYELLSILRALKPDVVEPARRSE